MFAVEMACLYMESMFCLFHVDANVYSWHCYFMHCYICSYFQRCFVLLMEEILHLLIGRLCHYLQGFVHPKWLFGISEPSTVGIGWVVPLPSNSDHQDYYIFSRESL